MTSVYADVSSGPIEQTTPGDQGSSGYEVIFRRTSCAHAR